MRTIGVAQRALDLMITRVTDPTRKTFGKQLSEHGVVVARVAESRMEIEQARLLVLVAAMQVSYHRHSNRCLLVLITVVPPQIDAVRAKGALREIGISKVCFLKRRPSNTGRNG